MSMEDKVVFFLIIITMILWGSTPIIEKIGLVKLDPIIGITIRNLTVTIGLLIFIFWSGRYKELLEVDVKGILIFSASGLMAGLFGMWTYYTVLKQWPTSKVVPISASYPLVTMILSALILKEGINISRAIGTLLIVLGIWLVKK